VEIISTNGVAPERERVTVVSSDDDQSLLRVSHPHGSDDGLLEVDNLQKSCVELGVVVCVVYPPTFDLHTKHQKTCEQLINDEL
jgi:hypothetical protein